jgi:type VII secretion integral membrane protein EccD
VSCRVTIVGARRRLDAELPDTIPVAELLSDIVGLLGENENGAAVEWGLVRVGGARLDPERSLAEQGVAEGTMLFLRDLTSAPAAPALDDFAGRVATVVEAQGGRWNATMPAALLAWVAAGSLALAGLTLLVIGDASARATAGVLGAVVSGLAAFALVRLARRRGLATVVMFSGLAAWAAAGAGLAGLAGAHVAAVVALGLAGAAIGVLVAIAIVGDDAFTWAVGVLAATGPAAIVAGGTAVFGGGVLSTAAVLAVVDVVALALLPAVTVRLIRADGTEGRELAQRLQQGRKVQTASLIGTALAIIASSAVMAASGGWFARGLVFALAAASILRARHYRFAAEVVPLLAAGLVSLILLELPFAAWLAVGAHVAAGLAGLLIADAILMVGAATLVPRWSLPPRAVRWLRPLEAAAVAATVPLALGQLGLYDAVLHFARDLH